MWIWRSFQIELIYCITDEWMSHPLPNLIFFMGTCRTKRIFFFAIIIGNSEPEVAMGYSRIFYKTCKMFMTTTMIIRHSNLGREIYIYNVCKHIHVCNFLFSSHSILIIQISFHYWSTWPECLIFSFHT